jgi:hypothetical protein
MCLHFCSIFLVSLHIVSLFESNFYFFNWKSWNLYWIKSVETEKKCRTEFIFFTKISSFLLPTKNKTLNFCEVAYWDQSFCRSILDGRWKSRIDFLLIRHFVSFFLLMKAKNELIKLKDVPWNQVLLKTLIINSLISFTVTFENW